jgi:simple sugar transport system permease protein
VGLVGGLVAVGLVALLFRRTVLGFRLGVMGANRRAALHAGMPVGRLTVVALLVSGGLAGLAGANDVLGVQGLFKGNWNPAYGFPAFALVYLARLHPLWLPPFAGLLALLAVGGDMITRPTGIPTHFVEVLEGLILVCFAVAVYAERRWAIGGGGRASRPVPGPVGEAAVAGPGGAE